MTSYVRYAADAGKQILVYPEPATFSYPLASSSSSSAAYPANPASPQPQPGQQLQTSPILRLILPHSISFWGPPFQIDYVNSSIISQQQADDIKDKLDQIAMETGPRRAAIIGLAFIGAVLFVSVWGISLFFSLFVIISFIIGIIFYKNKAMARRNEAVERFVNVEMAGIPEIVGKGWRMQTQTLVVKNRSVMYVEVWDHAAAAYTGYAPVYYPGGGVGYADSTYGYGYGYGAAPMNIVYPHGHGQPPVYSPPASVGYGLQQQVVVQTYNPASLQ